MPAINYIKDLLSELCAACSAAQELLEEGSISDLTAALHDSGGHEEATGLSGS